MADGRTADVRTRPANGARRVSAPPAVEQAAWSSTASAVRDGTRSHATDRPPLARRFTQAQVMASAWLTVAVALGWRWVHDLATALDSVLPEALDLLCWLSAVFAVGGIAWVPAYLYALLLAGIWSDRPPPIDDPTPRAPVTVLIAAKDEQEALPATLRSLAAADSPGPVRVVVVDNGSRDATAEVAHAVADRVGLDLTVVSAPGGGKARALNAGLAHVDTTTFVTLDADTRVHPAALRQIIGRLRTPSPPGRAAPDPDSDGYVAAVAGHLLVASPRRSWWTGLQAWDYRLAIAGIKRFQGMFRSTLVAQGAFSAYRTSAVREAGGWDRTYGEDILLTWKLLAERSAVLYEPEALAWTDVPPTVGALWRQRRRWARGMVEALRATPPRRQRGFAAWVAGVDWLVPWLDLAYTLVWLPGLVAAAVGVTLVVGPWTLLVLPVVGLTAALLYRRERSVLRRMAGDNLSRHRPAVELLTLVGYLVTFQMVQSPASLAGYAAELIGRRRRW